MNDPTIARYQQRVRWAGMLARTLIALFGAVFLATVALIVAPQQLAAHGWAHLVTRCREAAYYAFGLNAALLWIGGFVGFGVLLASYRLLLRCPYCGRFPLIINDEGIPIVFTISRCKRCKARLK